MNILRLCRFRAEIRGAAIIETALLVALVAVVCIASIGAISEDSKKTYCQVANQISPGGVLGRGPGALDADPCIGYDLPEEK